MKTIYISGRISGIENEAPELFESAELLLKSLGYDPINPMKINHNHDKSWESYMKEDIKALLFCKEIYMLNNWIQSRCAIVEHGLAQLLGIKISYQPQQNNSSDQKGE